MINTEAIIKRMTESGVKVDRLARALRVTEIAFYRKITNRDTLTVNQAEKIQDLLGIPDSEFSFYFFA